MSSNTYVDPAPMPAEKALRRVAVVIVTYNGKPYIADCLRSLFSASEDKPEVIVVDNASTDGSAEVVRSEFPDVRVISAQSNLGYGAACNQGALASQSEYIAIVNQDVSSTPGWIEHLIDALDRDPTAAMATPKILLLRDPDRINTCGNTPHYTGITICRGYNRPAPEFAEQEEVASVSGAAFVIRRTVFEELGGFDPTFFLYLEDTELSLRVALAGYRCLYVPEAVVLHDFEPRFSTEKVYSLERNRLVMLLKVYRLRTLLALLPSLLLTEMAVWGYSLLRGQRCLRSKVRAYGWVLAQLPRILRMRRQTQALRRVGDSVLLAHCSLDLELGELDHPLGQLGMALVNPLFRVWYRIAREVIR